LTVKVNGVKTAEVNDTTFHCGPIGLEVHTGTVVHFRKIEIKELPPSPPAPRPAFRSRRFAPPRDTLINGAGVTATASGWKIKNSGLQERTVRLFEVRNLDVKDWRVVFRAQMKTETSEQLKDRQISVRLETTFRPRVVIRKRVTGDTFTEESLSAPARTANTSWLWVGVGTNCFSQPEVIGLNLRVKGIGTVWLKDVELVPDSPQSPFTGQGK
jgi:hypothetical protein